ncbi:MAG: response regulator transcription factor [Bacteroidetes bacterium]|nr:response regulator transcription factor [Bacteroidota bacterium]
MKHTIAIVDDHSLFADGLERILQEHKDFEIVAKCTSAEDFEVTLNHKIPQLVLLDIRMKGQNGLDFCKAMKQKFPSIKVIIISMFEALEVIEKVRLAGADGYLHKSTDAELVRSTIVDVLNGHQVFLMTSDVNENIDKNTLSKREREILSLIKKGMGTQDISKTLFISQYTVETHKRNMMQKLNVNSQRELIVYAFENML